ncbi:hypothetical protein ACG3SL_10085 [Sphingomonas sp. CJ20]
MRALACLPLLLACQCSGPASDAPRRATEAEWRAYAIDGIAPMMERAAVEQVLTRQGYAPCPRAGSDTATLHCYARGTTRRLLLGYRTADGQTRLTHLDFNDPGSPLADGATNRRAAQAFADALARRFGTPDDVLRTPAMTRMLWYVPRPVEKGAEAGLRDTVSTVISDAQGENVAMRSDWPPLR